MTKAQQAPAHVFYSGEDDGSIAIAPDLPGCPAFGDTQEEAVGGLLDAIVAWQIAARNASNPVLKARARDRQDRTEPGF